MNLTRKNREPSAYRHICIHIHPKKCLKKKRERKFYNLMFYGGIHFCFGNSFSEKLFSHLMGKEIPFFSIRRVSIFFVVNVCVCAVCKTFLYTIDYGLLF